MGLIYAIWDKKSKVITPSGEVFTPEQWKERYPVAAVDGIDIVCGAGLVNGSFFGVLDQMVNNYKANGCDFSGCNTADDYINRIEDFEMNPPKGEYPPTTEERTAAALEALVMLTLPDEEA